MKNLTRIIQMAIVLGILSVISLVFGYLALTGIAKGESDLGLEWAMLRATAVLVVTFHALAMVALVRALKALTHGE